MEKGKHVFTVGGIVAWCSAMENSIEFPEKNRTAILSNSFTSGYLPEENKNSNMKRHMHTYVYCNIVYNSQDMKAT